MPSTSCAAVVSTTTKSTSGWLTSSSNVFTLDANGKPVYDFTITDQTFDAYKAAKVRPMVEFGFMPKDLTSGADPYQVHYPGRTTSGSSNAPPKDYAV